MLFSFLIGYTHLPFIEKLSHYTLYWVHHIYDFTSFYNNLVVGDIIL